MCIQDDSVCGGFLSVSVYKTVYFGSTFKIDSCCITECKSKAKTSVEYSLCLTDKHAVES